MAGYSATGTLSYNGFTFAGARKVTVNAEMIQDEAQRTVAYVKHTITVEATIAPGSGTPTDATLESIRMLLTKQGRELIFTNEGYGTNLTVNATGGGGVRDVKWGPVPQLLSWESVGNGFAVDVVWSVTTCIPECTGARYSGIMAQNYEVLYDIDEHGDTTRTISGYIEIAQTWNGSSRTPPDNADAYRQRIAPAPPTGFERKQSWKLSKDKSRLDFTIIDREIPSANPYPADVTVIEADHTVSWSRGKKGLQYHNTISAKISMRRGISGSQAWLIFGTILNQRRQIAESLGKATILVSLDAREDIFGRTSSFSARYWFTSSIGQFLNESGLWIPIGTNWNLWKSSLANDSFNNRGHAGLQNLPQNDVIVDLCGSASSAVTEAATPTPAVRRSRYRIANKKPPTEQSYMHYESRVHVQQENKSVRQSKLQEPPTDQSGYPAGGTPDVVQERGAPSYTYILSGQATRAGYDVPRPSIQYIGDQKATPTGSGVFEQKIVGNFFGVPVYAAWWWLAYVVSGPSRQLPIPPHLQERVNNGEASQPT